MAFENCSQIPLSVRVLFRYARNIVITHRLASGVNDVTTRGSKCFPGLDVFNVLEK